jgi:hypothetical protein
MTCRAWSKSGLAVVMKSFLLAGAALAVLTVCGAANAAEVATVPAAPPAAAFPAPYPTDWNKLIGDDPLTRFFNYYFLESGHADAPPDPSAPPGRRAGWGASAPQSIPPYPFTEWPYGGTTYIGVTRPNSVDSPLMAALANTEFGKSLNAAHIQIYGWINVGGNLSTNTTKPGGNWPASYMYTPNTVQLDQAVVYIERVPDTVQKDHVDWGFRISPIYGENYRYTTSYGFASSQLLNHNNYNGYDIPMMYGELYIPQVADGLILRLGRYISLPDIEAQLAPNNYMYSHSLTYTFDNYTNHGLQATLALNKNWFVQLGVSIGTDTGPWHWGQKIPNPFPNVVFPGPTMLKDPGAKPSPTVGVRWESDNGNDNVYLVANAFNDGTWGYNNLQWYGVTWYHKVNEQWHFSWETYTLSQKNVLNANNATAQTIIANGGTPFGPPTIFFNAPGFAQCSNVNLVTCTARVLTSVIYINYKPTNLDNLSLRLEYYHDEEGQRTGTATRYAEVGLGWQHWFSPQVELRPEVTYYRSFNAYAFNGDFNALPGPIAPTKGFMWLGAMDVIWHF